MVDPLQHAHSSSTARAGGNVGPARSRWGASPHTALPELGVGIIYSSGIESLLHDHPGLIQVLEVEPQTLWLQVSTEDGPRFKTPDGVVEFLAGLPGRKLVHSVGAPVGGSLAPPSMQLDMVRQWVERLDAPWASEHLGFNATLEFHAGFFLAPRQTPDGVEMVVDSIRRFQQAMPVPVAIETGVNYLRPRHDELLDGQFVAEVAREAGCGILLDLHNVFTNALNGRQSVDEFLSLIPLDRVWEVHVAGGMEMDGFWLDGHCDVIPDELLKIIRRVVPALPNLRAIIFEVFPSFVPVMGLDQVRAQLERMQEVWRERGQPRGDGIFRPVPVALRAETAVPEARVLPVHWEETFARLVIGREPDATELSQQLAADPGVEVIRKLIREFRGSMLVNVLRLTMRLILLALGEEAMRTILAAFWERVPPQFYATTEAEKFADFLESIDLRVPHLAKVLAFERALLATAIDDVPRLVHFDFDPVPLLRALAEGRLPEIEGKPGSFEIEVTPDSAAAEDGLALNWLGPNTQGH